MEQSVLSKLNKVKSAGDVVLCLVHRTFDLKLNNPRLVSVYLLVSCFLR